MPDVDMEAFWDARARENAAYFVDNRLDYAQPDLEAFWAGGEDVVARFEQLLGFTVAPADDVVEVGCGMGRLTRALKARAATVRALDVSGAMLERARESNADLAGVEWLHGDGVTLTGVADASADGVFSHVVFQHVPDPAITYGYVAEMGRVLRPGGWAAFHVSTDPSIHRLGGGARAAGYRVLAVAGRRPKGSTHAAWLGSAVDLGRLRAAAADAGLDVERVVGEGSQYCLVLLRRRHADTRAARVHAYENPRPDVGALVPASARRVLDLGCSSGALGAALKAARPGLEVIGVELDRDYAADAAARLDRVVCADVAELAARPDLEADLGRFDCLVCADVLEHLVDPWGALEGYLRLLEPGGHLVVSVPNVRYWETFWTLARRGHWPRRPMGLFDRTHLRWFTIGDALALVGGARCDVVAVDRRLLRPTGMPWPAPVAALARRLPVLRTLLALQVIVVGRYRG